MFTSVRLVWLPIIGMLLSAQVGCVSMSTLLGQKPSPTLDTDLLEVQGYSIPPGGMPSPVAPSLSRGPSIVLEVRDDGQHLESIPLPMDRAMYIEDLVKEAQLSDRLGRVSVSIMRPNGSGAPPVRLDSWFDDDGKSKNIGQNYALLPGDHVVVVPDKRSSLTRFLDKTLPKR